MTVGPVSSSGSPPGFLPPSGAEALIAEVTALLRARGERMTGPRRAVLTVLAEGDEHLSAEAVLDGVTRRESGVHRASVYRTLEALSDLGIVQHIHVGHGGTTYHLVRNGTRHLHAHCRVCGVVRDLPSDLLDGVAEALSRNHQFLLDPGHVALSGTCLGCRRTDS
ncbi:MAG: Fur family transcriptional regulator, ferric uptake regulator [Actinomycetota bacterium]|nr:Fur family transcriptional regulator, ferric uptake regulator [Actinomycetota bacterium]